MSYFLNPDDVVSVENSQNVVGSQTFKVQELMQKLRNQVGASLEQWNEGIECEVLKADSLGWQTGKVCIGLRFIPDAPEFGHEIDNEHSGSAPH